MEPHDRLRAELVGTFRRMTLHYGAEWAARWKAEDAADLLTEWARSLAVVNGSQDHIARVLTEALRNLPERPPSLETFRRLCLEAQERLRVPAAPAQGLPVRGPTPQERANLVLLRAGLAAGSLFARPGTAWAFAIVQRHERGEPVSHATLKMARDVVALVRARTEVLTPDSYDAHPSALEA